MEKKAVIAIINYGEMVLIGKKRSDSNKFLAGAWHLPGENVEKGESDEQALVRCGREELGIEIKVGDYVGNGLTPTGKRARWYECFSDTDRVVIGSDLEGARWVKKGDVPVYCPRIKEHLWSEEVLKYFIR